MTPTTTQPTGERITRYFLTLGDEQEREVDLAAYCRAERQAGFFPKGGGELTPATGSFGSTRFDSHVPGRVRSASQGRSKTFWTTVHDGSSECTDCGAATRTATEQTYEWDDNEGSVLTTTVRTRHLAADGTLTTVECPQP